MPWKSIARYVPSIHFMFGQTEHLKYKVLLLIWNIDVVIISDWEIHSKIFIISVMKLLDTITTTDGLFIHFYHRNRNGSQ